MGKTEPQHHTTTTTTSIFPPSSSTGVEEEQEQETPFSSSSADFLTPAEESDLTRGLHQRHVSLIAIAGAIGTGLFLGLGSSIQLAGPLGALLGYFTVGWIVCSVQFALGETTALLPVTGSFVRHAEFLIDPAVGFAVGWNIVSWCSFLSSFFFFPPFFFSGFRFLVIFGLVLLWYRRWLMLNIVMCCDGGMGSGSIGESDI